MPRDLPGKPSGRRRGPVGSSAGRVRARPWSTSKALETAREARERERLERGIRLRSIYLAIMAVVLAVAALDVLLGSVGLIKETRPRPLTGAERAEYIAEDVARRWRAWPIGMVFPEELPYAGLGQARLYARRVGVAPEAACDAATDPQVAAVLRRHGCRTLLRATYVDQSATFAVTVGVAVMESEEARASATAELRADGRVGVRPVAFPGTVADRFGADQRQRTGWVATGPYIVFSAVGYADGRTRADVAQEEPVHSEMEPFAETIAGRVARALGEPPEVPRCTKGNEC